MLRREDTQQVLGSVGGRYNVVQNQDMFKPFHETVVNTGATYETAGTINNGGTCWVTARLPKGFQVGDDRYEQRMVMMMNHASYRSNSYFLYNHRVICNNMMNSLNHASREQGLRIRHSSNWQEQVSRAHDALDAAVTDARQFKTHAETLSRINMNRDQAAGFSTAFIRRFRAPDKQNSVLSTRESGTIEQLVELFTTGAGNTGDTRYDMFNAMTEWCDHHASGVTRKNTNLSKRYVNSVSGHVATRKTQGMSRLLDTHHHVTASKNWYLAN